MVTTHCDRGGKGSTGRGGRRSGGRGGVWAEVPEIDLQAAQTSTTILKKGAV